MLTYEDQLRPLLFRLSPERAHSLAQLGLRRALAGRLAGAAAPRDPRLARDVGGLACANPVGLAPGFDKDGRLVRALDHLGFGYLTVGSITPRPRPGNPKPRLARYPAESAIGNAMGLPSVGVARAAAYLSRAGRLATPVVASVAGFDVGEVRDAAERLVGLVDGVELGLICPNTDEGDVLGEARMLSELVGSITVPRGYPLFVKLPPYHDRAERQRTLALVDVCAGAGPVTGVSLSGTRVVDQPALAAGRGSLAGAPVFSDSLRICSEVAGRAGRLAVKASGGVMSGRDAARLLDAGATGVELYSALVYRGPRVARKICAELLEAWDAGTLRTPPPPGRPAGDGGS